MTLKKFTFKIIHFILGISILSSSIFADPFSLPNIEKPQLVKPKIGENLIKTYKSEFIGNSSHTLNIINQELNIPGRGSLGFQLTRKYTANKWDQRKSQQIIDNYVNDVWANPNYFRSIEFTVYITLGYSLNWDDFFGGSFNLGLAFTNYLSGGDGSNAKGEFKKYIEIQSDMNSQHEFKQHAESMLGQNWDLYFNNFNRLYIVDKYYETPLESYKGYDGQAYLKAMWKHQVIVPSATEGNLYFYRSKREVLAGHRPFGLRNFEDPHMGMGNIGEYGNGDIDDELVPTMPVNKNYKLTFTNSQYVLQTLNGTIYIYKYIQDITNRVEPNVGDLDFEYNKRVAFLSEVLDIYGNKITIQYADQNSGKVSKIILSTSESGLERAVELKYQNKQVNEVIWNENNKELKKILYNYNNKRLFQVTDPIGNKVEYQYYTDTIKDGLIKKVIYPNFSYSEYDYNYPVFLQDSLSLLASGAVKDMLYPNLGLSVIEQRRYDIHPVTKAIRRAIIRKYYRTMTMKGEIKTKDDGFERNFANSFKIVRSSAFEYQQINQKDFKTLIFMFDKYNRLIESYNPIKKENNQTLEMVQKLYYGDDIINTRPLGILRLVKSGIIEHTISTQKITYDMFDRPTQVATILSNDTIPYSRTTTSYKTINHTINAQNFIVHLPEVVRLYDKAGTLNQQTKVVYNSLGQITELKKHYPKDGGGLEEKTVSSFYYNSTYPWLLSDSHTFFDNRKIITSMIYDDGGRHIFPTTVTTKSEDGTIQFPTIVTYDDLGRVDKVTDVNGNETSASYDKLDRMIELNQPVGLKLEFIYQDALNTAITKKYTNNLLVTTESRNFDGYGRPLKTTSVGVDGVTASELSWILDERGLVKFQIIRGGGLERSTYFEYDMGGRVVLKRYSDGSQEKFNYDGYDLTAGPNRGLVSTEMINHLGQITRTFSDFLGRKVKIEQEKGTTKHTTINEYNLLGKVTKTIWNPGAMQKVSLFTYDNLGRLLTARHDYDGSSTGSGNPSIQNKYNIANKIIQQIQRDGTTIDFTYDGMGRILQSDYQGSTQDDVQFTYDVGVYAKNKLTKVTTSQVETSYNYGIADRLKSFNKLIKAGGLNKVFTINYTYDGLGRVKTMNQPGKSAIKTFNYSFDTLNRLTNVSHNSQNIAQYSYDGLGQLTSVNIIDKFSTLNTYDRMGRLTQIDSKITADQKQLFLEKYTYDSIGNRTSTISQNGSAERYSYSPVLSMLQKVEYPYPGKRTMNYTYDKRLNRTSWQHLYGGFDYVYDAQGKLSRYYIDKSKNNSKVWVDISYDQRGNTTGMQFKRHGSTIYTNFYKYNKRNQLIEYSKIYKGKNGQKDKTRTSKYAYDHTGLRLMSEVQGIKTYYLYDDKTQRLLSEMDKDGNVIKVHVYGLGSIGFIDEKQSSKIYINHKDPLGTPRLITDATGKIVYSSKLGPFGNVEQLRKSKNIKQNYTGKFLDPESKLYYFHARYYNPVIGRFLSVDPGQDGNNWWVYVGNNPLVYVDHTGEFKEVFSDIWGALNMISDDYGKLPHRLLSTLSKDPSALFRINWGAIAYQAKYGQNLFKRLHSSDPKVRQRAIVDSLYAFVIIRGITSLARNAGMKAPNIKYLRSRAVKQAWKQEVGLVKRTGQGTRAWTRVEIRELLSTGKVKGYIGHHINSVKGSPKLVGNPNNIRFIKGTQNHLIEHGGNFRNITYGNLMKR